MAGLKRRAVQERMPEEVARRAEKSGSKPVDWYAGREAAEPQVESSFDDVPPERTEELAQEEAPAKSPDERPSVLARIVAWIKGHGPRGGRPRPVS